MNKKYTYRKYLALILLFSSSLTTHAMLKKARAYFDKKRTQRLYHGMGENEPGEHTQDFQGEQKEPEEQSQEDQDPEYRNR